MCTGPQVRTSQSTIRPQLLNAPRLTRQRSQSSSRLAALPAAQRPGRGHLDTAGLVSAALLVDLVPAFHVPVFARDCAGASVTPETDLSRLRAGCFGSVLQRLEQRNGAVVRQVLVVVIVDLDHGCVGAGAEALDFGHSEEAVFGRLAVVDAERVFAGLHDGVAVAEHAGCLLLVSLFVCTVHGHSFATYCGADLDVETADWVPIVHGVERGHLVHAHRRHLQQPSDLVHDADAREAVLPLAEVEQWHDSRLLVL
jgi:hypothetical protein